MPRPSTDYLDARRAARPASGGTNYAKRALTQAAQSKRNTDDRTRRASLDLLDLAHEDILALFAEFRSWAANLPTVQQLADGEELEF